MERHASFATLPLSGPNVYHSPRPVVQSARGARISRKPPSCPQRCALPLASAVSWSYAFLGQPVLRRRSVLACASPRTFDVHAIGLPWFGPSQSPRASASHNAASASQPGGDRETSSGHDEMEWSAAAGESSEDVYMPQGADVLSTSSPLPSSIDVKPVPDVNFARAVLVLCTVLWAVRLFYFHLFSFPSCLTVSPQTYNPTVRWTYQKIAPDILPSTLNLQRSLLSSILYVPFLFLGKKKRGPDGKIEESHMPRTWEQWRLLLIDGISVGVLSFFGNAFGATALKFTAASRATFLSSLNIILTPALSTLFFFANRWLKRARGDKDLIDDVEADRKAHKVPRMVWGPCFIAAVGALVISQEARIPGMIQSLLVHHGGAASARAPVTAATAGRALLGALALLPGQFLGFLRSFNMGDLLCVAGATFYALHVVRLGVVSQRHSSLELALVKRIWITGMSVAWMALEGKRVASLGTLGSQAPTLAVGAIVLFLAIFPSSLATWLQNVGQNAVPASEAAIIYALQPVWAAMISYALMGEVVGPFGWLGAALITTAVLSASRSQKKSSNGKA